MGGHFGALKSHSIMGAILAAMGLIAPAHGQVGHSADCYIRDQLLHHGPCTGAETAAPSRSSPGGGTQFQQQILQGAYGTGYAIGYGIGQTLRPKSSPSDTPGGAPGASRNEATISVDDLLAPAPAPSQGFSAAPSQGLSAVPSSVQPPPASANAAPKIFSAVASTAPPYCSLNHPERAGCFVVRNDRNVRIRVRFGSQPGVLCTIEPNSYCSVAIEVGTYSASAETDDGRIFATSKITVSQAGAQWRFW